MNTTLTGDEARELNRQSYNRIASSWSEARRVLSAPEQSFLSCLLEGVPAGAWVLDLGCGTGQPMAAAVLAEARHVLGVDQAEDLLAVARRDLPDGEWVESTMQAFTCDRPITAAIIWDALFHVSREEHRTILEKVVSWLPLGGRLMLTCGGSAHPAFTDTMWGERFFYDSYDPETTTALVESLGCQIVHAEFLNPPTDGRDKGRYALVVERKCSTVR